MGSFQWTLHAGKFLTIKEVRKLRKVLTERKEIAERRGNKVAVRDWFVIDLALSTGLRVQEIADLKCADISVNDNFCYLIVNNGKGHKKRLVRFNGDLKKHFLNYLQWKQKIEEGTKPEDPLIVSSNTHGHLTKMALQKTFYRSAKRAGVQGHSIHHLRHTYASHLYKASGFNLRLVQKQLGHSSIKTTEVYADVFNEDMEKALERLYA
ncbi:site-specific integrase [bacterium]|nr:site-specific integrase [bacterium]